MASSKVLYGRTKDGRMTPCKAKDPYHCPYHVSEYPHVLMTESEAAVINEVAARAAAGPTMGALRKSGSSAPSASAETTPSTSTLPESVRSVFDGDPNGLYDRAVAELQRQESLRRAPIESADSVVPPAESLLYAGSVDDRERAEYEGLNVDGRMDLRSSPLIQGEDRIIATELAAYDDDDARRGVNGRIIPSPAQERLVSALTSSPTVSSETMMDIASDPRTMNYGAWYVVDSPYATDDVVRTAYETAPAAALGAPRLPADMVNRALTDRTVLNGSDPAHDRSRGVANALRNPNVDPSVAYRTVRSIVSDPSASADDRERAQWAIDLNSNEKVVDSIVEMDRRRPESEWLEITRDRVKGLTDDAADRRAEADRSIR